MSLCWICGTIARCSLMSVHCCVLTVSLSLCLSICTSSKWFIFLSAKDEVWKYDNAVFFISLLLLKYKAQQMPYLTSTCYILLFVPMVCNTPPFSSSLPLGFGLLWVDWSLCWCSSVVSRLVPPPPCPWPESPTTLSICLLYHQTMTLFVCRNVGFWRLVCFMWKLFLTVFGLLLCHSIFKNPNQLKKITLRLLIAITGFSLIFNIQ